MSDPTFESDRCLHEETELRRRVVSNGVAHTVLQCLDCGIQLRAVGKADPLYRALKGAPPEFDHDLTARYWEGRTIRMRERVAQSEAEREEAIRQRRADYDDYIQSREWRVKANQRLANDEYQCRARMDGCTGRATQVHHLSYLHLRNEPLFELISVCASCHRQLSEGIGPKSGDVGYAAAD